MLANVGGLGRRVGERDGSAERLARIFAAAEAVEQDPAHAVEVEVAAERPGERLDHRERRFWACMLPDRDGAIERNDRRWRLPLEHRIERVDPCPVGVLGPGGANVVRRDRRLIWYGPGREWRTALSSMASASAIIGRFQRARSWSSSRIGVPSAVKRAACRECCMSMSARRPISSGSDGNIRNASRARRIASSQRCDRSLSG